MSLLQDDDGNRRLRFDGTITAGNLITTIVVVGGLLVWGLRLEGRVDTETQMRQEQHTDILYRLESGQVREQGNSDDIKRELSAISTKLDTKMDKQGH